MIKLLNQTTEYYCSTEEEAQEVINQRKENTIGKLIKQSIEVKDNHTKLVIKEEYHSAIELSKQENDRPEDDIEYYEMLDEEGNLIEHIETKEEQ